MPTKSVSSKFVLSQGVVQIAAPVLHSKSAHELGNERRLYEEDGWIFRERPGKPIECVRRLCDLDGGYPGVLHATLACASVA